MNTSDLLITLTSGENDENNVTIAFTMGLKALEKKHAVEILLLSDAVYLAEKEYADRIDIGKPFEPINKILPMFLANKGKISVCSACMEHNGVSENNIINGVDVITADYVIDALMSANKTLQLN